MKLEPATQWSACESNSQRAIPCGKGEKESSDAVLTAQIVRLLRRKVGRSGKTSVLLLLLCPAPPRHQASSPSDSEESINCDRATLGGRGFVILTSEPRVKGSQTETTEVFFSTVVIVETVSGSS
jgi:hypothetical protein